MAELITEATATTSTARESRRVGDGCEGRWREDHERGWHGHFSDRTRTVARTVRVRLVDDLDSMTSTGPRPPRG